MASDVTDGQAEVSGCGPPEPLLIDIRQVAALLGRSVASLERDRRRLAEPPEP
jgi:hypothetical protein